MKFGVCGMPTAKNADGSEFDLIQAAKQAGFDYMELPVATVAALSEEDFAALKARVAAGGLPVEAMNVLFPGSLHLTGLGVDWKAVKAYLRLALGRAGQLGAKVVVFGSGGPRKVPEGYDHARAWGQLIRLLRMAEPIAAKNGLTIVIEPLNQKETNIIHTGSEGLALAKLVDRPHIRLLIDLYHMHLIGEDPGIAVTARGYLRHAHFAKPEGRCYPAAQEDEFRAFFAGLRRGGYDERVSIEASYKNFTAEAPVALAIMKEAWG